MLNYFVDNRDICMNDFNSSLYDIYDNKQVIDYLLDYHKKSFSFFIGLSEEELEDLDKVISYKDSIILEDWRMCSGSKYYIVRDLFKTGITLRDIFNQLKDNLELRELLYNENNEDIILVNINQKIDSDIHYELFFDSCF
tara:strand:- start:16 stop:435 length:420 start_codon:yes stop_codon:yes gene_type:complete